jgi:transposase
MEELRAEVARFRKQRRRAELERAILEKATAYYAKGSL